MNNSKQLVSTKVSMDWMAKNGDGEIPQFKAFRNPEEYWNGWACPYFTKEQADRFVDAYNEIVTGEIGSDSINKGRYDRQQDAFVFFNESAEEDEVFVAETIGGRKLYPIGAFSWCWWIEENDDDVPEERIADAAKIADAIVRANTEPLDADRENSVMHGILKAKSSYEKCPACSSGGADHVPDLHHDRVFTCQNCGAVFGDFEKIEDSYDIVRPNMTDTDPKMEHSKYFDFRCFNFRMHGWYDERNRMITQIG